MWQAEPEGGVWDREVLGKLIWFRYQNSSCRLAGDACDVDDISEHNWR